MSSEFQAVIGLEVHCQLASNSKLFCNCKARLDEGQSVADEASNRNSCPVCSGHPGTLPVLNEKAVKYAVMAGLATECTLNSRSVFARKNYFYPDLPKGYQISQYERPLCVNGKILIETAEGERAIGIHRIHMEEDAGKNVHMTGFSVVNLNRAGVPLVEIVSEPEIYSAEEAVQYLKNLYAVVTYLDICDGNLQEGNFRCDANVSVRPTGEKKLGTRTEIKNINSFRFVEKAIEYEIARQIEVVKSGESVVMETRGYDSAKNQTFSMRSKEEAHDYRYFPDPDLIPLVIEESWIEELKGKLPELPQEKKKRYLKDYGLNRDDVQTLTASKHLSRYFESILSKLSEPGKVAKTVANLLTGEVSRLVNETGKEVHQSKLSNQHIVDVHGFLSKDELSSSGAKQVIARAWESGESVASIVEREGLRQISDTSTIEPVVEEVIRQNAEQVEQLKAGKDKVMGFLVGQVMKASKGKANPKLAQELLRKKIK